MSNILLIENEESVSEVIKAYLEKEGYHVYCALKGLEGMEILKLNDIKLIILDLMLPDISGEEVFRLIKQKYDIHSFILTVDGFLEDKMEGLNFGANDYLLKPFSPRELTARVNAHFSGIK